MRAERTGAVSGLALLSIPIAVMMLVSLAVLSVVFGRHGYHYQSPFSMCCGCVAIAIMLPVAFFALKMLARMYSAFDQ